MEKTDIIIILIIAVASIEAFYRLRKKKEEIYQPEPTNLERRFRWLYVQVSACREESEALKLSFDIDDFENKFCLEPGYEWFVKRLREELETTKGVIECEKILQNK